MHTLVHLFGRRGITVTIQLLLALTLAVSGVLAFGAAPTRADAPSLVIDDFDSGTVSLEACGSDVYNLHSDASILGGKREIVVRDAWSCVFGGKARARVDAGASIAELYGAGAVEQTIAYGSAIGIVSHPWSPSPNVGAGTALNLALTPDTEIVVDMVQVHTPFVGIHLLTGSGSFAQWFPITIGTNSIALSSFVGMTATAAADVDGIRFFDAVASGNTPGSGNIFDRFAISSPVLDSDGDGVPDDQDAFPDSDLFPTVVVGGSDTGVGNHLFPNGATFNDLIAQAKTDASNHGEYVSAVSALTNDWKSVGLISGKEKGKIVSTVAKDK